MSRARLWVKWKVRNQTSTESGDGEAGKALQDSVRLKYLSFHRSIIYYPNSGEFICWIMSNLVLFCLREKARVGWCWNLLMLPRIPEELCKSTQFSYLDDEGKFQVSEWRKKQRTFEVKLEHRNIENGKKTELESSLSYRKFWKSEKDFLKRNCFPEKVFY